MAWQGFGTLNSFEETGQALGTRARRTVTVTLTVTLKTLTLQ